MRTPPRATASLVLLLAVLAAVFLWPNATEGPADTNGADSTPLENPTDPNAGEGRIEIASNPEQQAEIEQRTVSQTESVTKKVVGEDGNPINGFAYLITVNDELIRLLETDLTLGPRTIYEVGDLKEIKIVDGELNFQAPVDAPGYLWVEVDGYKIHHWHLAMEEVPETLQLELRAPFSVKVLSVEGGPVPHANVEMQAHGSDDRYNSASWQYRLEHRTIEIYQETSAEGIATFASVPDHPVQVRVSGMDALGTLAQDMVTPSGLFVLQATNSCRVVATVRDTEGEPMPEVFMVAFRQDETGERHDSGSMATGEDGRVDIEKVSCTGEDLSMAFFKMGYEMVVKPLKAPRPGQSYEFEVRMEPAIAVNMKLIDADNQPIADMVVDFEISSHAWVPISHTTSADGTFKTPPLHKPGAAYWMKLFSAGGRLRTMRIFAPIKAEDVLTVKVDGIGALRKQPGQEVADVEYSFVSLVDPDEQTFIWKDSKQTPWLPAGIGVLQTVVDGNAISAVTITIPSGVGEWPSLDELAGSSGLIDFLVGFELKPLPEEQVQAYAVGRGSIDVLLADVVDKPQSLTLPFLPVNVELRSNQRGTMSLGTFSADELPVDLGVLDWSADCSVVGSVQTDDEFPLQNCLVSLLGTSGQVLRTVRSDETGAFSFTRLTPGVYWVRVEPFNGSASWHPASEHAIRFTNAGQSLQLDVRYPESGVMTLQLSGDDWRRPQAWMLDESKLYRSSFDRDWKASLPQPSGDSVAWVVDGQSTSAGGLDLRLIHAPLAVGQESARLSTASLTATTISVDAPHAGRLRIIGPQHQELASFPLVAGAQIKLLASNGCPLYLQFQGPLGVGRVTVVDEVLAEKSLTTDGADFPHSIQIRDMRQRAIPNCLVLTVQGNRHWRGNDRGIAKLPADFIGSEVEIHSPGYFPTLIQLGQKSTTDTAVTLRGLSGAVEIEATEQARTVQLTPQFQLSFPLPELTESSPSKWSGWEFPEGNYWLVRLDANGVEVKRTAVTIDHEIATSFSAQD